jgi:hypothetical protein
VGLLAAEEPGEEGPSQLGNGRNIGDRGRGAPRRMWQASAREDGAVARLLRGRSSAAAPRSEEEQRVRGLELKGVRQRSTANNDGTEVGGTEARSCGEKREIRRAP